MTKPEPLEVTAGSGNLYRDFGYDNADALLMKDLGCSANASRTFQIMGSDDIAAKRDIKLKLKLCSKNCLF